MRCNIGYKKPEKIPRWTMFWYVVYYHCSEFQIFRSLNGLHFSVLSLYPNSFQNLAWFCLHFSDHSKPKQTDVISSHFVYLSLINHGRFPAKIDQWLVFPLCCINVLGPGYTMQHCQTNICVFAWCCRRHRHKNKWIGLTYQGEGLASWQTLFYILVI